MGADLNSEYYPDPPIRGVLIFSMSVFCLVTVVSNVLVIVTVLLTKKLRTISSVFLINLCIADLGNGLLTMPFILVELAYDGLLPLTQVRKSKRFYLPFFYPPPKSLFFSSGVVVYLSKKKIHF